MPKVTKKKTNRLNFRNAGIRFQGSPKAKTQEVGIKMRLDMLEETRTTANSLKFYDEPHHVQEAQKRLKLYKALVQQRENELLAMQRAASLRTKEPPPVIRTNHVIPGSSKKTGRPLTLETLQSVASICASGSQYTKVLYFLAFNPCLMALGRTTEDSGRRWSRLL